ncbi:MAG: pyrroline-5-carboxylate reductase [Phycisphaeraceae bacterium]|nr:pyrroline-5-carboxylate reductase [Phycisphaeraceae bacterium]
MSIQLAFAGFGNMAEAIALGAINGGVRTGNDIAAFDPSAERQSVMSRMGIRVMDEPARLLEAQGLLVLAIKPQVFDELDGLLSAVGPDGPCVVSIMAGITLGRLRQRSGKGARLVRVMPNTPLLVGAGMSAISAADSATSSDIGQVRRLFEAAGRVIEIDENLMDAVTAVSGSGPAYLFYLAQAMLRAASELGLSPDQARLLVDQTLLGASRMLERSEDSPEVLRQRVTSKGGTTQAATTKLDESDVAGIWVSAIKAAAQRSKELAV